MNLKIKIFEKMTKNLISEHCDAANLVIFLIETAYN